MKNYILILISLLSSFGCGDYNNESVRIREVSSTKIKVYIKEITWGLTGDNKVIYIGFSKSLEDTISDMFFRDDYFFYKMENDTLYTYTVTKANRKEDFIKKMPYKEIVLKGEEMINLTQEYKSKGLQDLIWSD